MKAPFVGNENFFFSSGFARLNKTFVVIFVVKFPGWKEGGQSEELPLSLVGVKCREGTQKAGLGDGPGMLSSSNAVV